MGAVKNRPGHVIKVDLPLSLKQWKWVDTYKGLTKEVQKYRDAFLKPVYIRAQESKKFKGLMAKFAKIDNPTAQPAANTNRATKPLVDARVSEILTAVPT